MRQFQLKKCKRVVGLSYRPDGTQVAVVTSDGQDHVGSVVWLDVMTGELKRSIELNVERCAISHNHQHIAIAYSHYLLTRGAKAVRWAKLIPDENELDWIDVPSVPFPHIQALEFNVINNCLAIGCSAEYDDTDTWEHATHIVTLGRGHPLTIKDTHIDTPTVGNIAFSYDGNWLAVSGGPGGDRKIRIHRLPKATPVSIFTPKATRTQRLIFAPDRLVIAALAGKQGILLDAEHGKPLALLDGHTAQLNDAAFTPDGSKLITVAHDGSVRVWNTHTGNLHAAFAWSIGRLTAVAIAPDGLTAIAAGEKGQFVVWDLDD